MKENTNIIIDNKPAIILKKYWFKNVYLIMVGNKECLASRKTIRARHGEEWVYFEHIPKKTRNSGVEFVNIKKFYIGNYVIEDGTVKQTINGGTNVRLVEWTRNNKVHSEVGPAYCLYDSPKIIYYKLDGISFDSEREWKEHLDWYLADE